MDVLDDDPNPNLSFINEGTKRAEVRGEFCKYLSLPITCRGRDLNCLETKTKGCHFYKKYERARDILLYFVHEAIQFKKQNVDISDVVDDIKFIHKELNMGGFVSAGRYLRSLRRKMDKIKKNVYSSP